MPLLGRGLFTFFRDATTYVRPDEEAKRLAGDNADRHLNYHRRIVWVSGTLGAISGIAALTCDLIFGPGTVANDDHPRTLELVIFGPLLAVAAGLIVGVAITCALAPREFLLGPLGQKWMKLIGTRSLLAARLVCAAIGLIVVGALLAATIAQVLAGKP